MKKNYKSWQIDFQEFYKQSVDKQLNFLIKFAVLSPSSHNSQPWKFVIDENSISIKADFTRALAVSDSNNRQLFISLGCSLKNILTAADYYGLDPEVFYLSNGSANTSIKILFKDFNSVNNNINNPAHLIFQIPKRCTNRNDYISSLPDAGFLNWLQGLSSSDVSIDVVKDEEQKNIIADIVLKATDDAMESRVFRKELSQYLKSNITHSFLGMPAFGYGIPTPISLFVPFMMKIWNMDKLKMKEHERMLKEHTPALVIISTKNDDIINWIKVGELFETIALEAECKNLKTHIMAAAIQIGEYYKELQNILNNPNRPQLFFRLGYCAQITPHSPRLIASEVITNAL